MAAVALRTDRASRAGQREEPSMATPAGTTIPLSQQSDTSTEAEAPQRCDVAIIGGGIAGLTVALSLPPELRVVLITKGALGESNTRYAQGGLAAAVGRDDSPTLHLRDTLAAGAGLVDEPAARVLVEEAGGAVAWLIAAGAQFDEREAFTHETAEPHPALKNGKNGNAAVLPAAELARRYDQYDLTREAAHSRRRVLHARDATGAEIERALVEAVRARPHTEILDSTLALDLLVEDGACVGVALFRQHRRWTLRAARCLVLANGGAGRLWLRTSNPPGATADGLALAWRAGAALADLEFAQFHPTVLAPPDGAGEPFLISEAVRGEGAHLRNAAGERFMPRYAPEAELAPRDVVARAILSEMLAAGAPCAYLDLCHLPAAETHARFPTIAAVCRRYGLDLARDLIPVAPAAHYFMGGVAVDTWARTTVPRLYAVGEVACTGVHGANRLASNSLLEGLVFGRRAAAAISGNVGNTDAWPRTPVLPGEWLDAAAIVLPRADATAPLAEEARSALRRVMWEQVSLRRNAAGLEAAGRMLGTLAAHGPFDPETASLLFVAQAVAACALARRESRGGHFRDDYPERDAALEGRHTLLRASTASAAVAPGERVAAHA
jgi:L-aspartate oxidase